MRHLIICVIGLFLVGLSFAAKGQENIATTRPGMFVGPWTLPENSLQWEQGFGYIDGSQEWNFDTFLRASISQSTEIRVNIPSLENNSATFGVKWMMIKPEGTKPGVGFSLNLKSAGDNLQVAGYRVALNKKLSDNLTGFLNAGKVGDGFFGDAGLSLNLSDRLSIMADYWYHQDWMQVTSYFAFLINSETQLDLGGAWLDSNESGYLFSVGFSRRFKMGYKRDDAGIKVKSSNN